VRIAKTPRLWLSIVELALGVPMLSIAIVYLALGGEYAPCQNPATFTVQACTTVVEVSVVGLIGLGLTFFGIIGTIIGSLVRAGYLTPRHLEPHPQLGSAAEPAVVHVPVQERRFSKAFPTRPVGPAPRIPSARRLEDSLGLLYRSPQTPFLTGSRILGRASSTDLCPSAHVRRSQVLLERSIVAFR